MFLPPCLFWWWVEQLWQQREASEKVEEKRISTMSIQIQYNFGNIFGARINYLPVSINLGARQQSSVVVMNLNEEQWF
jgi:hypothetical protein